MAIPFKPLVTIIVIALIVNFGLTFSPIGGNCTIKYDCARGLSCINKICECEPGKRYSPLYTQSFWPCDWKPTWPRDYGACQSPFGSICRAQDDCLTERCSNGLCACSSESEPDENGGCRCRGATWWKPEVNRCDWYANSRYDANLQEIVCDENQTIRNDTTKSCDCLVVPGDPTSGILAHSTWNWQSNICECQSAFVLDPSKTRCVCGTASVLNSAGNYCEPYKNAILDLKGKQGYICGNTTTQNDEARSCDCDVAVAVFDRRRKQCKCPEKKELFNNCL